MTRIDSILTKNKLDFSIKLEEIIMIVVAFFLSRVSILSGLTPFGLAFLAAYTIMGKEDKKVLFTTIISLFLLKGLGGMNYYLASLIIYGFFINHDNSKEITLINSSILSGLIFLGVGLVYSLIYQEIYLYGLMMIAFESLLIFTMTYVFSFSLSIENMGYGQLKNEKIICSFITFALVISGATNIIVFDIGLKSLICIFLVIYLSYTKGLHIGSTVGIVLGMITFISSSQMPYVIGLLAVGGILAGLFRDLGKFGSLIGFLLGNTILSFYINGLGTSFFNYREIGLASLLFILFGSRLEAFIDKNTYKEGKIKKTYEDKKFELASNRLAHTKEYLDSVSEIFEKSSKEVDIFSKEIIYELINDIEKNKCRECENHEKCWSNEHYKTYYSMFTSIGIMESNLEDSKEIIEEIFEDCENYDELFKIINMMYNVYKKDETINKRYINQNKLFVEQIDSLGQIIEDINLDIYKTPTFNNELEELLEKEIKDRRIDLSNILFVQLEGEKIEIYLEFYSLNTYKKTERIIEIVSNALGYKVENNISFGSLEKTNSLKLIRANRYSTITKINRATSSQGDISGDNFTFGRVDNTNYMALSDGMGIGEEANFESKAAIEILERMVELGGTRDMTLRSINNILRAKSEDEIFTTLDLSFIDLYTGRLEIVKSGSAPTFIKRKNECIVINSESLPMGIFNDVEFNIYEERVEDGDLLIMMSDGVLEANKKTSNHEKWMKDLILSIDSQNPQVVSDEIFNTAKLANRNIIDDDMTLLVTKIWKDR